MLFWLPLYFLLCLKNKKFEINNYILYTKKNKSGSNLIVIKIENILGGVYG